MKRLFTLSAILIICFNIAYSQGGRRKPQGGKDRMGISGKFIDSETNNPMYKVNVLLMNMDDSLSLFTISSEGGYFQFNTSDAGTYKLIATFMGYKKFEQIVQLNASQKNLGILKMTISDQQIGEVAIKGQVPMAVMDGDTTVYNADAFKVNPDANAEDLIRKMPGVEVDEGKVKAHGEDVKEVMLDGKNFFGYDPTLALRSIPAEIIDKIQVFDKQSDQSKFTGFDDGQESKTINIVTRKNMRNGKFGNIYAGYGANNEYAAGGKTNIFDNKRRISIIAQSNNINEQNFATEDLLGIVGNSGRKGKRGGGGGRGGSRGEGGSDGGADVGDFMVDSRNGVATTHALGINYSDSWGKRANVTGSYFFNQSNNEAIELLYREYILEGTTNSLYNENSIAESTNNNHRINMKIELNIDSANAFIIRPRLNFQTNNSTSSLIGENQSISQEMLSKTDSRENANLNAYNFSNNLLYRHKFQKQGRTISINLSTGTSNNQGLMYQYAPGYTNGKLLIDTINQQSDLDTKSYNLSSRLMYTEPMGENSMLQLNYGISYSNNDADRMTYNYNQEMLDFNYTDTLLSNTYLNDYLTQSAGFGFHIKKEEHMFMARAELQVAELKGEQAFPNAFDMSRSFKDVIPMLMYSHRVSREKSLRIMYRTSTNPPSISQLQDVIDNSNPLQLSTGNPYLKQAYSHRFSVKYNTFNSEKMSTFFVYLSAQADQNHIGNSIFYAFKDTLIHDQILLQEGGQLSRPENMDGYYNLNSLLSYGIPVYKIKSNINVNTGLSYNKLPGLVNGTSNSADNYGLNLGLAISSNISEKIDFTISSSGNYNIVNNTTQENLNYNYYAQTTFVKATFTTNNGIVLRNQFKMKNYKGLSKNVAPDYYLWNMSVGKKVFKNQMGEVELQAFDLLNQNKSIKRNVTEFYIEDNSSNVLQRFFMLKFTYKFRNFKVS